MSLGLQERYNGTRHIERSFCLRAPEPAQGLNVLYSCKTIEIADCCAKVGNPTVVPSRMMDKEVWGGEILTDLVPTPFGGRYAHHTHISG